MLNKIIEFFKKLLGLVKTVDEQFPEIKNKLPFNKIRLIVYDKVCERLGTKITKKQFDNLYRIFNNWEMSLSERLCLLDENDKIFDEFILFIKENINK